eukprot:3555246-Pyramimonas_sp.AAC.1
MGAAPGDPAAFRMRVATARRASPLKASTNRMRCSSSIRSERDGYRSITRNTSDSRYPCGPMGASACASGARASQRGPE